MSHKIKIIIVSITLYCVFLIAMFPANVALHYANSAQLLPKEITLDGVSGSVWKGRLIKVKYQDIELENVRWNTSIMSMLTGDLKLEIVAGNRGSDIKADGLLTLNGDGLSLNDFTLKSSIEALTKIHPLPFGLITTGKLTATIDTFTQGKPWCNSLDAQLNINDTLIKSPLGKLDITSFAVNLSCPNGVLTAITTANENTLGIDGNFVLNKSKKYNVKATVAPPADATPNYINLLKFSGKKNAQGQYTFKHNGRL